MSESISMTIRTADEARKANIELPPEIRIGQLLEETQQRWNLPEGDYDYAARLERTNEQLDPNSTLANSGIKNNDVLEILPIVVGGLK